ncbi:MAG: Asp-tRNA(Asn)/Glu-tRNA(Gln) amidotransferase GatCAB subunit A [Chloroflexi bacterium HGW-Chloroflexi-6]|nr:MAG: Asp-tRNA(Asn)/Glu-tRNA(Gln) amidotransferase GatCAB subunit A [Chloroflexi bacterium HGW-Chloroflexi-6]
MELHDLTIIESINRLRAGEITPDELTSACLAVIDAKNPTLNVFAVKFDPERIAEQSQGELSGIPIVVKDLIDIAGIPTAAGSPKFFGVEPALKDAFVVDRLKYAGATLLGKTNTHEIALGITGINPHTGAVRNPHSPERITGGSSSGSAAAVASGMALGALGTDTGGSIRIPAALCGVAGFKPTFGRVSTRGVLPLSWNLDHVGPIAKTVADVALLYAVIAGYDPHDPNSLLMQSPGFQPHKDMQDFRVALAVGDYIAESDPEILQALGRAAEIFASLGAEIVEVEIPRLREAALANGAMVVADAAAFHRERLAEHPDWFGADVRERLEKGRAVSSTDYALARRVQSEMKRYFGLFFDQFDVLLLPTTASVAAPIDGLDSAAYASRLTRFTAPFNLTGLPALSVPGGVSADGLPIGLQLVGPAWSEAVVLQAGQAFEASIQ